MHVFDWTEAAVIADKELVKMVTSELQTTISAEARG